MRYFLCFLFPPLACLSCGKFWATVMSLFLTVLFYVPGVIHAFAVVGQYNADKRQERLVKELRR